MLRGGKPGKTVALRQIWTPWLSWKKENKPLSFPSTGKMHACGHDGHYSFPFGSSNNFKRTAEITGMLNYLPTRGRVHGGAKPMIEEGVLADHPG